MSRMQKWALFHTSWVIPHLSWITFTATEKQPTVSNQVEFLGDKLDSQSLRGILQEPWGTCLFQMMQRLWWGVRSKCAKNERICGAYISNSPSGASGASAHVLTLVQETFMFLGVSATSTDALFLRCMDTCFGRAVEGKWLPLKMNILTSSSFEQCTWPSNASWLDPPTVQKCPTQQAGIHSAALFKLTENSWYWTSPGLEPLLSLRGWSHRRSREQGQRPDVQGWPLIRWQSTYIKLYHHCQSHLTIFSVSRAEVAGSDSRRLHLCL